MYILQGLRFGFHVGYRCHWGLAYGKRQGIILPP